MFTIPVYSSCSLILFIHPVHSSCSFVPMTRFDNIEITFYVLVYKLKIRSISFHFPAELCPGSAT